MIIKCHADEQKLFKMSDFLLLPSMPTIIISFTITEAELVVIRTMLDNCRDLLNVMNNNHYYN